MYLMFENFLILARWLFTETTACPDARSVILAYIAYLIFTFILLTISYWFRCSFVVRVQKFQEVPRIDRAVFILWALWMLKLFVSLAKYLNRSCIAIKTLLMQNPDHLSRIEFQRVTTIYATNELFLWGLLILTIVFLIFYFTPAYYMVGVDLRIFVKFLGIFLLVCWALFFILSGSKIFSVFTIESFADLLGQTDSFEKACAFVIWNGLAAVMGNKYYILSCIVITIVILILALFYDMFIERTASSKLNVKFTKLMAEDTYQLVFAVSGFVCLLLVIKYLAWYFLLKSLPLVFVKVVCFALSISKFLTGASVVIAAITLLFLLALLAAYFIKKSSNYAATPILILIALVVIFFVFNSKTFFIYGSICLAKILFRHSLFIIICYALAILLTVAFVFVAIFFTLKAVSFIIKFLKRIDVWDEIVTFVLLYFFYCIIVFILLSPAVEINAVWLLIL